MARGCSSGYSSTFYAGFEFSERRKSRELIEIVHRDEVGVPLREGISKFAFSLSILPLTTNGCSNAVAASTILIPCPYLLKEEGMNAPANEFVFLSSQEDQCVMNPGGPVEFCFHF